MIRFCPAILCYVQCAVAMYACAMQREIATRGAQRMWSDDSLEYAVERGIAIYMCCVERRMLYVPLSTHRVERRIARMHMSAKTRYIYIYVCVCAILCMRSYTLFTPRRATDSITRCLLSISTLKLKAREPLHNGRHQRIEYLWPCIALMENQGSCTAIIILRSSMRSRVGSSAAPPSANPRAQPMSSAFSSWVSDPNGT